MRSDAMEVGGCSFVTVYGRISPNLYRPVRDVSKNPIFLNCRNFHNFSVFIEDIPLENSGKSCATIGLPVTQKFSMNLEL